MVPRPLARCKRRRHSDHVPPPRAAVRRDGFGDGHLERVAIALDVASAALEAHPHAPHATVREVRAVELRGAHGSTHVHQHGSLAPRVYHPAPRRDGAQPAASRRAHSSGVGSTPDSIAKARSRTSSSAPVASTHRRRSSDLTAHRPARSAPVPASTSAARRRRSRRDTPRGGAARASTPRREGERPGRRRGGASGTAPAASTTGPRRRHRSRCTPAQVRGDRLAGGAATDQSDVSTVAAPRAVGLQLPVAARRAHGLRDGRAPRRRAGLRADGDTARRAPDSVRGSVTRSGLRGARGAAGRGAMDPRRERDHPRPERRNARGVGGVDRGGHGVTRAATRAASRSTSAGP